MVLLSAVVCCVALRWHRTESVSLLNRAADRRNPGCPTAKDMALIHGTGSGDTSQNGIFAVAVHHGFVATSGDLG